MNKEVKRYSKKFRKSIIKLCNKGKSYSEISQKYGISKSSIFGWIKKEKEENIKIKIHLENKILKKALGILARDCY